MNLHPKIDVITVIGIALFLMPVLTMAHEVGGHAAMCLATGSQLNAIGAFYVDCHASSSAARRLVALAGVSIDMGLGAAAYLVWREQLRGDLARLIGWYVWVSLLFSAAGYFLFSGITGIGDLGVGVQGGIGPLPQPMLWRAAFVVGGGAAYFVVIKRGMAALAEMIGQGPATRTARRTAAHAFYAALCLAAVAASLPNPVGLFITLASAAAASFGGKAGLISIGQGTRNSDEPRAFAVARNWPLLVAGMAASAGFALVLGPTLRFV